VSTLPCQLALPSAPTCRSEPTQRGHRNQGTSSTLFVAAHRPNVAYFSMSKRSGVLDRCCGLCRIGHCDWEAAGGAYRNLCSVGCANRGDLSFGFIQADAPIANAFVACSCLYLITARKHDTRRRAHPVNMRSGYVGGVHRDPPDIASAV
jgi:hypothetical protein